MKKIWLFLALLYYGSDSFSQKKVLDLSVPETWPAITSMQISNNGKQISNNGEYVMYTIASPKSGTYLTVQATTGDWKREVPRLGKALFTEDSKRLIFQRLDSIGVLDLVEDSLSYITNAGHYETPKNGNGQWLAYQAKQPGKEMVLRNLFNGNDTRYPNVTNFRFSEDGKVLIIQARASSESTPSNEVAWIELKTGKRTIIARNCELVNMTFDHACRQLAFLVRENRHDQPDISMRYFKPGTDSAITIADPSTRGMEGMTINEARNVFFSPNDKRVFFFVENAAEKRDVVADHGAKVTIQNYALDDVGYRFIGYNGPYLSCIKVNGGGGVVRLQKTGDNVFDSYTSINSCSDNYVLLRNQAKNYTRESYSNPLSDICLVSYKDGSRISICNRLSLSNYADFSPGRKYVYWFDSQKNSWFTYSVSNSQVKNVTAQIKNPLFEEKDSLSKQVSIRIEPIGWLENDEGLLIQDRFDVWQVDPKGMKPPINLTHSFGQQHQTRLSYLDFKNDASIPIRKTDTLLFSAMDQNTKMNGFFQLILGEEPVLDKLIMEQRLYYDLAGRSIGSGDPGIFIPRKARMANVYAVKRMSASEYPNLFISRDLKQFKPITSLEPQAPYNWFTTELHHWKMLDGAEGTGVLYKPENFDPQKKYPVIFFYYQKASNGLNLFSYPDYCYGAINVPWFVSRGYLVFIPDISYKIGYPGQSAYNSVVSAAEYLAKKPFVDALHMGLQGHSFGGYETNYIVTKNNLFAAAAPSAGVSDLISGYAASDRDQFYYERGQGRIGSTLWEHPDLYIENSPIFRADKVTTPLLIMGNEADRAVPFQQTKEWYHGLVRAGKKAWLLSYEGEGHLINQEQNQRDYTIRLTQFFDHYLKGAPPAKWMTQPGVSVTEGLELDTSGKTP